MKDWWWWWNQGVSRGGNIRCDIDLRQFAAEEFGLTLTGVFLEDEDEDGCPRRLVLLQEGVEA
jgi:hypothetical protein